MTQITFELETNFPNGINKGYFEYEIRINLKKKASIQLTPTEITISFVDTLTTDELNLLQEIVVDHNPNKSLGNYSVINLPILKNEIITKNFIKVSEFYYDTLVFRSIYKMIMSIKMDIATNQYPSIKLFDKTNAKVLAVYKVNDITENNETIDNGSNNYMIIIKQLQNVPFTNSVLEVHVKNNCTNVISHVHINQIDLYLEK